VKAILLRGVVDAAGAWLAILLVPGVHRPEHGVDLVLALALYALLSAAVRPFAWLLTCPLMLASVGLSLLALNSLALWVSARLAGFFGLGFTVDGALAAVLGALVVGSCRVASMSIVRALRGAQSYRHEHDEITRLERARAWLEGERDRWRRLALGPATHGPDLPEAPKGG
jgi:putative membrane protein